MRDAPAIAEFCPALKNPLAANFSLEIGGTAYIAAVKFLTKQEQMALCLIFVLLLTGWAVKTWRTAHPAAAVPIAQPS